MNYNNSQYHLGSTGCLTYFIVVNEFVSFGCRAHNKRIPSSSSGIRWTQTTTWDQDVPKCLELGCTHPWQIICSLTVWVLGWGAKCRSEFCSLSCLLKSVKSLKRNPNFSFLRGLCGNLSSQIKFKMRKEPVFWIQFWCSSGYWKYSWTGSFHELSVREVSQNSLGSWVVL